MRLLFSMALLASAATLWPSPAAAQKTQEQQIPLPGPIAAPTPIPVLIDPPPASANERIRAQRLRATELLQNARGENVFQVRDNDDGTAVVVVHDQSGLRCGAENLVELIVASPDLVGCVENAPSVLRFTIYASPRAQSDSLDSALSDLIGRVQTQHSVQPLSFRESDSAFRRDAFPRRRMARFKTADGQFVVLLSVTDVGDWRISSMSFAPIHDENWQLSLFMSEFHLIATLSSIHGASAEVSAQP